MLLGVGAGVAALAVGGVLALSGVFGGDDSSPAGDPSPTRTPAQTATSTAEPTASPTDEPTTGPTEEPTPEGPPQSIETGEWTYNLVVDSNSCGTSPAPGELVTVRYFFDEAREPRDGYISNGELVGITYVGSNFLGNFVFSWPQFTFNYVVSGGGTAVVGNTFVSPVSGHASLTETYPLGNSTCSIYLVDAP